MLDKEKAREYNIRVNGLVAQLGAHHIRIVGVEGSNPFKSTMKKALAYASAFFNDIRSLRKRTISLAR